MGHFFSTCCSTARKCAFFENRHPSQRFAWFLRSWRHAGGSFFRIFSYFSTSVFWFVFRLRFSSILARFWGRFWDKNCEKTRSKNCSKKRYPPRRKRVTMTRPGGSWRPRLACAFFEQETMIRATAEALIGICAGKVDWVRNRCTKN